MSSNIKTVVNNASVVDFINAVPDEAKKKDSLKLVEIFSSATGEKPKMWGTSIIGFGQYHYKSERSRQEGDWMLTGFSPRKQNLSVYIMPGFNNYKNLLEDLGKHKISGGSCLYVNKLEDINLQVLKKLIKQSYLDMKKQYD